MCSGSLHEDPNLSPAVIAARGLGAYIARMRTAHGPETRWLISGSTLQAEVRAENWLVALGYALEQNGTLPSIHQMACERLENGSIIVNDLQNRRRYRVQPAT